MEYFFKKAHSSDTPVIWQILQAAIQRRKQDGSQQWQDGYPNMDVVQKDIEQGVGFVLKDGETIAGYAAVMINNEPAYADIEGEWLTNSDFVVLHRLAVSENYLGKGIAKKMLASIEELALSKGIHSVKADTNFDNMAMLNLFEKLGYTFCGQVYFRGSARKAFEKVI
ncbi:MAG: GNAT family N-acetyltransferase [Bacteroidota bacterium]